MNATPPVRRDEAARRFQLDVEGETAWLDYRVEGDQVDAPLFSGRTRRAGYARVDAFARYGWAPRGSDVREIALTGKVQNLLNRHYEERIDLPAPGINFLVGAEVSI